MPVRTHVWKGQEMPVAYQRTDPERQDLAQRILANRKRMGETQQQHYARYNISYSTYIRWEQFGPPRHAYIRDYVKLKIRSMRGNATGRASAKEKANRTKDAGANRSSDK